MENVIEHKFHSDDIFFVFPQGEKGNFFPDMLVKVLENQEGFLVENKKVIQGLRRGSNSITQAFSGFVIFLKKEKLETNWGTREPVPFKDKDLSLIYIKAYGLCSFEIEDEKKFIEKLLLEKEFYLNEELQEFLRNLIFFEFSNVIKEEKEISKEKLKNHLFEKLKIAFENYGMKIINFEIKGGNFIEEKEKEEEKKKLFCKKCKKEIQIEANFCPFCGEKILNICPSCKKEIPEFAKFCPFCGKKISI